MVGKMTNKRSRQPDPSDEPDGNSTETCDEVITGKTCPHIGKAVNFSNIKKHLNKNGIERGCITCMKTRNGQAATEKLEENPEIPNCETKSTTWICLQCGHQGCRENDQGHAFEHHVKPHSDCHSLVVDTLQWTVWCYQCQIKINTSCGKKLQETVEFIKRHDKMPYEISGASTHHVRSKNLVKTHEKKEKQNDTVQSDCPKGLINPGNNCFFNAVLQCLAQTPFIVKVLQDINLPGKKFVLDGGKHKVPNTSEELELPPIEGTLEGWGNFTSILCDTLLRIRNPTDNSGFYPSEIVTAFRKKSTQCLDDGQHDSHELLRHLLDLVRNEDLRRYQSVILQKVGLNGGTNPDGVEEKLKSIVKFYGNQASSRLLGLEPVFSGILISTLECLNCHHTSQKIEPFLDLSLPIMADKPHPPGPKKVNNIANQDYDDIDLAENRGPSKHQLKKEKKALRKNRKKNKWHQNKEMNHETTICDSDITEDNNDCTVDSAESEADVEDNIEVESLPSDPIESPHTSTNDLSVIKDSHIKDSGAEVKTDNHLQNESENVNTIERRKKRRRDLAHHITSNAVNDITTGLSEVEISRVVEQSISKPLKEGEYSIQSCLDKFTALELMTGSNKVACETCTASEKQKHENTKMVCTPSTKQYLISRVPAVLILHLKRCEAQRIEFRKVTKHVSFPLTFDLAPICRGQREPRVYALYGVVQHSGTVHGGHYTAYVKSRVHLSPIDPRWSFLPSEVNVNGSSTWDSDSDIERSTSETSATVTALPGKWFHVSDSRVIEVDEKTVLKSQAYLLFYERIL